MRKGTGKKLRPGIFAFLGVLAAFLLSGCAGLVQTGQPTVIEWTTLSPTQTVGQTFVADYDGLTIIYFYLSSPASADGEIRLHLQADPLSNEDIVVSETVLAYEAVISPGYYGFSIPPQATSNQRYYYAFLEVTGSAEILIGTAPGGTYLNGALYQNGQPQDAQAAFQLSYSRRRAIAGLGGEMVGWLSFLAAAFFLFIIPGWGLFSLLWPTWMQRTWPEKLALSAGLSLAIYPLLLLWTNIIGLHLGAIYAWLPPLVGLGIIIWRNRKHFQKAEFKSSISHLFKGIWRLTLADGIFLIVLASIIFTRFWVIRSLDLPMWGDSYQHTMISQLLVDNGGLFTSWQPYAEMTTFTYHFGFHSAVAVFDWITRMDMVKAVLWVGQILNVLAVLVLYPLALKISRSRWAAIAALIVAGLLSPMPMFYVNWGRYTQLAGQVILPVVAWVMWEILAGAHSAEKKRQYFSKLLIGCLLFGALALTHYRVLILAIMFLLVTWILYARRETWLPMLKSTFWVGLGGGALFMPWFIHVFGGRILKMFAARLSTSATQAVEFDPQITSIGNLSPYLPPVLWLALLVIIGIGLWRREKSILLIILWWLGCFLVANPWLLGLPGTGAVPGFLVLIGIYIPAALLIGAAIAWMENSPLIVAIMSRKIRPALSSAAIILLLGLCIWGVVQRLGDLKIAQHALASRPDVRAADWLAKNTPPDARVLI